MLKCNILNTKIDYKNIPIDSYSMKIGLDIQKPKVNTYNQCAVKEIKCRIFPGIFNDSM